MSAHLAIDLSDQIFSVLSDEASVAGKTPAELVATVVERIYGGGRAAPVDATAARLQFEECLGSVDLGRPIGVVNEAIDADLAREYRAVAGSA